MQGLGRGRALTGREARENRDHGGAMSQPWVSVEKEHLGLSVWCLGAGVGGFFVSDAFRMVCLKGKKKYVSRS